MAKKDGSNKRDLGMKIREAILKFGSVEGNGAVICMPTEDSKKLLGGDDDIRDALGEVGIDEVVVENGVNKAGTKMTCIATTVDALSNSN